MSTVYPTVGAHFRPPAKAILATLPAGHPLILRAEPLNPYDPNAIMVLLRSDTIPVELHADLSLQAADFGYSIDEILAEHEWHLGYIPRAQAQELRESGEIVVGTDRPAKFTFTASGASGLVLGDASC